MPDPIVIDDPEPQRYYDWMLWKMRQEDKAMKQQTTSPVFEKGYPDYDAVNSTQVDKEVIDQLAYVTAEECAELTQVCMKIVRFGMNSEYKDKRQWLVEEAGDVYCMLQLMIKNGLVTQEELEQRAKQKTDKLKTYTPIIVKE